MARKKITIKPGTTTGPQAARYIEDMLAHSGKMLKELDEKWGLKKMQLSRWRNGANLSNGQAHLVGTVLKWLGADVTITT